MTSSDKFFCFFWFCITCVLLGMVFGMVFHSLNQNAKNTPELARIEARGNWQLSREGSYCVFVKETN